MSAAIEIGPRLLQAIVLSLSAFIIKELLDIVYLVTRESVKRPEETKQTVIELVREGPSPE